MTEETKDSRGRKRIGEETLTSTERSKRYIERLRNEGVKPVRLLPRPALRKALEDRIAEQGGTITGTIIEILETYLNVPPEEAQNTPKQ